MVNKKGQMLFYALMLGIIILVLALALAGPVREFVDSNRNETTTNKINATHYAAGLNCSSTETISIFDRGACIVSDLTIFHFIGGLIFIAGAVIIAKIVF